MVQKFQKYYKISKFQKISKSILPLDEGVRVINTLCEKIIPRVLIYPNTFIQGQYVYIIKQLARY
jgi:hypothetical protein